MSFKDIYQQHVFPRLLHQAMRFPSLSPHRKDLLRRASGRVLEIGFGTGANLPYYTSTVKELTTLDSNPGMQKLWRSEAARLERDVRCFLGQAEKMPFETGVFDTVVSTLTLCSVDDVASVLTEVRRVLKPHGILLFLEHGLAPDEDVVKWQKRLEPMNKILADGCHLTRPIETLVRDSGFLIDEIERFYLLPSPKTHTWFVKGVAIRPS